MAKALVFVHDGVEVPVDPEKVDRSKLYGWVDTLVLDETGRPCEMATLASDGQTLIGKGGTALAQLSVDGEWMDKPSLTPVDAKGALITPVKSSFDAPITLDREASVDDFLAHDVRLLYTIDAGDVGAALVAALRAGTIYTFPYSFRGGLQADVGFLLANDAGVPFLLVGESRVAQLVGLSQSVGLEEEGASGDDADGDDLDFGMM